MAPVKNPSTAENRERALLVGSAKTRIETATRELELALRDYTAALPANAHPVIEELRETILAGRKMIARSTDILKRIP